MKKEQFETFEVKPSNVAVIILMALSAMLSIWVSKTLSEYIDSFTQGEVGNLSKKVILVIVLSVGSNVAIMLFSQYLPLYIELKRSIHASKRIITMILQMPVKQYERYDGGYYMNLITGSAFTWGCVYVNRSIQLWGHGLCVLLLLLYAFSINKLVSLIIFLYIPILYFVMKVPGRRVSEYQKAGLSTQDAFLSETKNIIENKRIINIAKANHYCTDDYEDRSKEYLRFIQRFRWYENISYNIPTLVSSLHRIFILIISGLLYTDGKMTIGMVLLCTQIATYIQSPLKRCFEISTYNKISQPHIDRLKRVVIDEKKDNAYEGKFRRMKALLRLKDFDLFTNERHDQQLFHVDKVEICKGQFIIVRGLNGSGKTSLLNYITGYSSPLHTSGESEMDRSLQQAAYLSNPHFLVDGTVQDNMFGVKIDQRLFQALNIDFTDTTRIKSSNLSLGEKQKMGLMRVLSSDSDVCVLDEPFSNLDEESCKGLVEYFSETKGKKSYIIIDHSHELDQLADQIIELVANRTERPNVCR